MFRRLTISLIPLVSLCCSFPCVGTGQERERPGSSGSGPDSETPGVVWNGAPGVTETVDEIRARDAASARGGRVAPRRARMALSARRVGRNPLSPETSGWPFSGGIRPETGSSAFFPPQSVGVTFLGARLSESGAIPPDCSGDVGPAHILLCVNGRVKSFSRRGVPGVLNVADTVFWESVRDGEDVIQQRVRFDRLSRRWFLVAVTAPETGPNRILIAVSSDSAVGGVAAFTYFQFQHDLVGPVPNSDTDGFVEFPTLGVDSRALYVGVNVFDQLDDTVTGTTGFVVRKSALLAHSLVVTAFRRLTDGDNAGLWSPMGVHNSDPNATEGYFIGVDDSLFGLLDIRRISNPGSSPSISGNLFVTVPSTYSPLPVPALGSTRPLDAVDDRLCAAEIRNGALWTAHNIRVRTDGVGGFTGTRNGCRWYEIVNLSGFPALRQSGTLFDTSGASPVHYWIPSVAASGQGHVALGGSRAGASQHAGIAAAGRLASDPLGETRSATTAQSSSSAYNAQTVATQEWGATSQTVVDPNDDMTFWTFQEYCDSTNSWGVRVIQLLAPPPAAPESVSPPIVQTGDSGIVLTLSGLSTNGSGFFDPGSGFQRRLSARVEGAGVTVAAVDYVDPTHLTLHVDVTGSALPGHRKLTITNPDSQSATSATAILTLRRPCRPITLAPDGLPPAAAGSPYSVVISAEGGNPPYSYIVTSGALPAGLALSDSGVLSGVPVYGGAFEFTVTAVDSEECTGAREYVLTIAGCEEIVLHPDTLRTSIIGSEYDEQLTATGGTPPYDFSVTGGSLPEGIQLRHNGSFRGYSSDTGTVTITVTAADSDGCIGSRTYELAVAECPAVVLSPASLPVAATGEPYKLAVTASGGRPPYTFAVTAGWLPAGITLSASGALSGTPPDTGTSVFEITAVDPDSCSGSRSYTLISRVLKTLVISARSGWNIVSNPLILDIDSTVSVFPMKSGGAFAFISGAYEPRERLENGKGYWLKFPAPQNVPITGGPILLDTVDVTDGWNLIGSVSQPSPPSSVAPVGTVILSSFFEYRGGYAAAGAIRPGQGYWVKVGGAGKLVVSAGGTGGHSGGRNAGKEKVR